MPPSHPAVPSCQAAAYLASLAAHRQRSAVGRRLLAAHQSLLISQSLLFSQSLLKRDGFRHVDNRHDVFRHVGFRHVARVLIQIP